MEDSPTLLFELSWSQLFSAQDEFLKDEELRVLRDIPIFYQQCISAWKQMSTCK